MEVLLYLSQWHKEPPTNLFENIQAEAKQIPKKQKFTLNKKRPKKAKEKKHPNPLWKKQKQI